MRKMGGLKKYMPYTFATVWIGVLALVGFPGLAGYFSKDSILLAVEHSNIYGSGYAAFALMAGVFVTAFYSFRLLFMTFYGEPRMDEHTRQHLKESPLVVTIPLFLLAVPSAAIGWFAMEPMIINDYFKGAISVSASHDVLALIAKEWHGLGNFFAHGFSALPFFLVVGGFITAWLLYIRYTDLPAKIRGRVEPLYNLLDNKYYFDKIYNAVFASGARLVGGLLWKIGDVKLIDGLAVNGTARVIGWVSSVVRYVQTGYVYHYAFAMIIGLFLMITFFLHG